MQDEQPQQDTSPAQPVDASPESAQEQPVDPNRPRGGEADSAAFEREQEAPLIPGAEESTPDGSEYRDDSDVAPDADEPGDDVAPEELEQYAQDAPDQPDNVDQKG